MNNTLLIIFCFSEILLNLRSHGLKLYFEQSLSSKKQVIIITYNSENFLCYVLIDKSCTSDTAVFSSRGFGLKLDQWFIVIWFVCMLLDVIVGEGLRLLVRAGYTKRSPSSVAVQS